MHPQAGNRRPQECVETPHCRFTAPPILVIQPGIWTWIKLPQAQTPSCGQPSISQQIEYHLAAVATETIFPFDEATRTRVPETVPLYWANPQKTIYTFPSSRWSIVRQKFVEDGIAFSEPSKAQASTEIAFDIEDAFQGIEKSKNRKGNAIAFDSIQRQACLSVAETNRSMRIELPMGAAKSLILAWIIFSLRTDQGHKGLRPLVLAGKSLADTRQLYETLGLILQSNPQWQTSANHLCLQLSGHALNQNDREQLRRQNGILVTTHRSLHKIPTNTKCILLDEEHAAATPAVISKLMRHSQKCVRIYGATATADMRPDKADRILNALIGPVLLRQQYRQYEQSRRIAPIHLHIYPFIPTGSFQHDPSDPYRQPSGASAYQLHVENHRGRHRFVAQLLLSLPATETKLMFLPTIGHAQKIHRALKAILDNGIKENSISPEDAANQLPIILHAQGSNQTKNPEIAHQVQQGLVQRLLEGQIKSAIVTDFLSTGVDTNQIDHILDASGQAAIATNIQRSGRAGRPRAGKIAKLHVVKDQQPPFLHQLMDQKLEAYARYYGFLADNNIETSFLNEIRHQTESRIFLHPEGIPSYQQETCSNSYIFLTLQTLLENS
jgi:superfamily II DNA or RNA helicase